jgi:predicted dehydrogenase
MSTPTSVGIVGSGFMGMVHSIAARSAGARVTSVLASSPETVGRSVEATGAEAGFSDLEAFLAVPGLDVVHICVPNSLHFGLALAAITAGKNVVCEKPLAVTVEQASQLVTAADKAGVVATVPFVYRFHPMVREMRHRIGAGEAGVIGLVHGTYLQDWLAGPNYNWRVDAGEGGPSRAFADIGSHWFDLLEFVGGDRVAALSAQFATVRPERTGPGGRAIRVTTEDTATVQFATTSGLIGTFAAAQVAAGRKNRLYLEISGSSASFAFDQEQPEQLWIGDELGHRELVRDPKNLGEEARGYAALPAGHPQGYQDCFNNFVRDTYRAIAGSLPPGLPSFRDGLRSAIIVDAVVRSQDAGGQWVTVPNTVE